MSVPVSSVTTVEGVIEALDAVIDRALADESRTGYFAAMYRKVTAKVLEGIQQGFFDDAERMVRLDVAFARRYLDALERDRRGEEPTRSWKVCFDGADRRRPLVLQHVLAGMSAHINLDLGIAAAETAPGPDLAGLRRDFDRVNEILALLVAGIAEDLGGISPWIGLLDRIGGRHDEVVISFSIEVARTQAWRFAVELAPLAPADWSGPIAARDAIVARVGKRVLDPGLLGLGLLVIRARESNDVRRNIQALCGVREPDLEVVERRVRQARAEPDGT